MSCPCIPVTVKRFPKIDRIIGITSSTNLLFNGMISNLVYPTTGEASNKENRSSGIKARKRTIINQGSLVIRPIGSIGMRAIPGIPIGRIEIRVPLHII
jgi:hypothetical protein